jgi:hypothetical protein
MCMLCVAVTYLVAVASHILLLLLLLHTIQRDTAHLPSMTRRAHHYTCLCAELFGDRSSSRTVTSMSSAGLSSSTGRSSTGGTIGGSGGGSGLSVLLNVSNMAARAVGAAMATAPPVHASASASASSGGLSTMTASATLSEAVRGCSSHMLPRKARDACACAITNACMCVGEGGGIWISACDQCAIALFYGCRGFLSCSALVMRLQ